ncbi:hypothetical protein PG993_015041 [Apiospora rasikravindrae]|uniref:Uncharacterized protein n=1 Tax=Apiospora rasikravindrae TaxID=990691 RepID=A0ABR1RPT9_9PEZI
MAGTKQTPGDNTFASGNDLKTLCYCMSTCEGFHLNPKALAPLLGISAPNNVPRKIKSIIEPLGFELKGGVITAKDGSGTPGNNGDSAAGPSTPVKPKNSAPKTPASKRSGKKRKLEDLGANSNNDEAEAAEAKKGDSEGKDQDEV